MWTQGSEERRIENIICGDCSTVSLVTCSHMGDERKDVKDSECVQKTSLSPAPTKAHMVKVCTVSRAQTSH